MSQTTDAWEPVTMDYHSPEPLQEIIKTLSNPRIRYICNDRNMVGQRDHGTFSATWCLTYLALDNGLYNPSLSGDVIQFFFDQKVKNTSLL